MLLNFKNNFENYFRLSKTNLILISSSNQLINAVFCNIFHTKAIIVIVCFTFYTMDRKSFIRNCKNHVCYTYLDVSNICVSCTSITKCFNPLFLLPFFLISYL